MSLSRIKASMIVGLGERLGLFAADYPGYDATGSRDCTAAVQAAINAANAAGTNVVLLTGAPKINGPLTYSKMLVLSSSGGGMFTNLFSEFPVKVDCSGCVGYLFDQPDNASGSGSLTLENLAFDGKAGNAANSTTWQGLVKASQDPAKSTFWLRIKNVLVGNGDSPTAILNLTGAVFTELENTYFSNWRMGYGIQTSGGGFIGTTLSLRKCYFNSLRQVAEFYDNQSDVTFSSCVMESCVVAVALLKGNAVFNECYSENMGYDPAGLGTTTGLTPRSFGISDAPAIAGNVSAVFTCRYGQMIFNSYTIQSTQGGKKWFDGIGRQSQLGQGGAIRINDLHLAAGTLNTLFYADADAPSSRAGFEYHLTVKLGKAVVVYADARMLTTGRVPIQFSDGILRPVEVRAGLFTVPRLTFNGFTAKPTVWPDVNVWLVGDVVELAGSALVAGLSDSWLCTVSGAGSAKWNTRTFMPQTAQGVAAASGGTFSFPVPLAETGTTWVYEASGTGFGSGMAWNASIKLCQFASGVGFYADAVPGSGVTVAYTYPGPVVVTNTNTGFSLTCYVRLVSVGCN